MTKQFFLTVVLLMAGCVTGSGAFPTMISHGLGDQARSPEAGVAANPYPASQLSNTRGRKLFVLHCQRCHGPEGHGNGTAAAELPTKPGNLAILATEYPDYYFYQQIAYGQEDMPSWRDVLKDSEIWDLVNYIKTLKP